ncbi:xanthine phosphoribosyltransferase [Fibrobacter sp. UWB2]|uniref:xanthine phosphoribosyltransferase n=1 Tax=Fibrobacter sp. UWB2 TaxID=1964358 RepID=UPI000B5207BE|nr:xanthine phosphoribosyltransferase [Fibrobacter sp. UWB2]OWV23193.1 xanthine phosphoribosyltransferase [Fibrobacter sp. UWB2]
MNFLEQKILADGVVKPGNVLKVDSFLNHQIDIRLMQKIGEEFKRRFADVQFNKVLTIEASGIAIAAFIAYLNDVPVVFAKKGQTVNSTDDKYVAKAYSFTHKKFNDIFVSRPYLKPTDKILIVDDFLADGEASKALIDLVKQASAELVGVGIAIEKGMQPGGAKLRAAGVRLESIAIVDSMDPETGFIKFREQ